MLTFATALQLAELIPIGMATLAGLTISVLIGVPYLQIGRLKREIGGLRQRHRALFEAVNGLILVNDARESMEADMVDYLQRQEEGGDDDRFC